MNVRIRVQGETIMDDMTTAGAAENSTDMGALLRDARRRRGMTLDDIARATKIRVSILRAMEANRREDLPEAIFLRGFVRAYAREVGLDPDDAVRQYVDQFGGGAALVQDASPPEPAPSGAARALAAQEAMNDDRPSVRYQWLVVAIVLVISLVGYRTSSRPGRGTTEPGHTSAGSSTAATPSSSPRAEVGTAGSRESTAQSATGDAALHLDFRTGGSCWLSATADGTRVVYRLMQAGEQGTVDIRQDAVLRVGDPAAFAFSIDGRPGRPLGPAGQPVTVRVTRDNYREFLRP